MAPTNPPERLADVSAFSEQVLRLQRRRTHTFADAVLESSAFRILWVLSDGAPRTLKQLAVDLDLEQSTVNRQVNAAIDGGWLERFAVEGSASRPVRPTTAGAEAFEHDGLLRAELIQAALDEIGPERAGRMIDDLRAYNDAWDAAVERAGR